MVLAARPIGTMGLGDNTAQAKSEAAAPTGDALAGTDTLTFGGSATLTPGTTFISGADTLTFAGSGMLSGHTPMKTETTTEKLTFGGWATLTAEVATVAPPATLRNVKRISPTMPTPALDSRGRPT